MTEHPDPATDPDRNNESEPESEPESETRSRFDAFGKKLEHSPVIPQAETSISFPGGSLACPAYPAACDYIRVVDNDGYEVAYWHYDEFAADPQTVLGALMGCAAAIELDAIENGE